MVEPITGEDAQPIHPDASVQATRHRVRVASCAIVIADDTGALDCAACGTD
eukprot:CAMPEP_0174710852 /NCGR_PEP_ID=MMETSP1094-20130205/12351_1 /TAXON_ID=156173 /ORGANISM="Chrysochromulina brevifilum, Strain UTEX LB 985" /LENGTH=50 /DNA_ID=CAMNT_0015909707 /DNA_START=629 /DNA_END=778 /DNA_ORIENTATION=-